MREPETIDKQSRMNRRRSINKDESRESVNRMTVDGRLSPVLGNPITAPARIVDGRLICLMGHRRDGYGARTNRAVPP